MAFRGYEMNLILRVQDRATTRVRRLSQDIGGLSRAADLQRRAGRIQQARARSMVQQTRAQAALEDRIAATGSKKLQNESQLLRYRAQQIQLEQKLAGMGNRNPGMRQALTMRLQAVQKDILRIQTLQVTEQARLNAEIAESIALEAKLAKEADATAAALARAQRLENFQRRARLTTHAGSVAMMAGGIGLLASAGFANQFASFNRLAVGAATQMRGINAPLAETAQLARNAQAGLLDMTREFPASADEMAASLYDIASGMNLVQNAQSRGTESQQRYNQSMRILRMANKVAIAGNLDLATSTDVLISTFNNFDPELRHTNQILNQLFAIVRFGKGTFAQFSPQIGRMAATANAAGQSLTEAGSALAFLSQRMPVSQAATALTRIFQIIGRKEFTTGFQELFKMSPFKAGTRQLRSLSELMFIVEKQGPRIWKGFTKGSVDVMNVLQNITAAGQNVMRGKTDSVGITSTEFARKAITNFVLFGPQYRKVIRDVTGDTTEFQRSLEAFRNQPGVQWQIAINQFKALGVVIGQDVIPHVLRFIDYVTNLGHKYEELSPHTKKLIGMFAAWGSAILTVGGAIATIVGGIGILIGRLGGLMGILGAGTGAGVVGRMALLSKIVTRLGAIGAISLIINARMTGDANAKQLLMGALSGAAAGAAFGPWSALAGGIAVPVAMKMAADSTHSITDDLADKILEQTARQGQKAKAYGQYLATNIRAGITKGLMTRSEFDQFNKNISGVDAVERNRDSLHNFEKQNTAATNSVLQKWQNLASQMTGIDLFGHMTQEAAQSAAMIGLNLSKAMASGNNALIRKSIADALKYYRAQIARLEKLPKTAQNIKALTQLYDNVAQLTGQLTSMNTRSAAAQKRATKEAERHRKEVERQQKAQQRANDAYDAAVRKVAALKLRFKQLREQEIDKLRSAFGDIFGGPLMQGPIGQAFTGIANTLAGFGQTFAIPADFILQDQKAQQKQFDTLMSDLQFLQKRGVQPKTIENIMSQGPSAIPFLEGIRRGSPAQQKEFIKNINSRNSSIMKIMQSPLEKQISASNTQLQAAQLQMKAAKARLAETKTNKNKAGKTTTTKPTPTRTTQSVVHHHHGDTVTVKADGSTPATVKKAFDRHAFDKRHRR